MIFEIAVRLKQRLLQCKDKKVCQCKDEMGYERPFKNRLSPGRGNEFVILLLRPGVGLSANEVDDHGYRIHEDSDPEEQPHTDDNVIENSQVWRTNTLSAKGYDQ